MRIAYYNPALREAWGAGVHARELSKAWTALGHEVLLLPNETACACRDAAEPGVAWAGRLGTVLGRDWGRRRCAREHVGELRSALRDFAPEVAVYRRLDYDYLADASLRFLDVPYVAEVNAVAAIERQRLHSRGSLPGERARERRYLQGARRVVCAAADIAEEVRELRVEPQELLVVHNGVDVDSFSPEVEPDSDAMDFRESVGSLVAYCATPSAVHDFDTLARGAALLSKESTQVGFLIVGPECESAMAYLVESGVPSERIHCTGRVSHKRVPSLLASADVLWGAISKETNLSLKVFEYMAMGKPVVMASSGSEESPVSLARAGAVVGRGDAEGLAREVATLLAAPESALEAGRRGRSWVVESATWKSVAARMVDGVVTPAPAGGTS